MKFGYTKRGFTELGYDVADLDLYWSNVNLQPWRPRVLIYDQQDPSILLHEYNSFKDNDLTIEGLQCAEQLGTAGNFSLAIRDDQRNLDRSKVGNANKIVVSMAKRQEGPWYNISSGYSERLAVQRDRFNGLRYNISGFGSGIIIEETLTDFRKAATRQVFGSANADPNDPTMTVNALMHYILESKDHLVASPLAVKDQGSFDLSLISRDLDIFVPVISIRDQPIAQAMNYLSDRGGSLWGVNANDQVWAWYPMSVHSGVTLKTFNPSQKNTDKISNTSYFFGPWDYSIPIDADSFGNVLISHAGTEPVAGNKSTILGLLQNESGTPLGTQEVIQQFSMSIPDISLISVLLKKVGNPDIRFVNGIVYADNATSTAPDLKNMLATFSLDVSQLREDVPTAVTSTTLVKTGSGSMPPIGSKAWIYLQAVGSSGNDNETVMWMHSGNAQTSPENQDLLSGTRNLSDVLANNTSASNAGGTSFLNQSSGVIPLPTIENTVPFSISNNAFTQSSANSVYTFATFYNTKTRIIRKDPLSIFRYGQVERYIDVPWTTDFQTISDLLFLMLQYTAYPQMIFNTEKVSIPSPPLQAGKAISIVDDLSGLSVSTATTALINSVGYEFNAYDLEYGVGTYFCDVNIGGIYDYLLYEGVATGGTANILSSLPPPLI